MLTIQFKTKVNDHGFFKFPMIRKQHVMSGLQRSGAISSYSNSDMFEAVLNRALKKQYGYPVGLPCLVSDLGEELGIKVEAGFLHTFTFTIND